MKTHRPWQPHMSNMPLFNPFTPAGQSTTLDHFDLIEEEGENDESAAEESRDQMSDRPPVMKRD
jgi:hypothetical protein